MALIDEFLVASDSKFIGRVTAAIIAAAHAILNEGSGTPNHANRIAFASKVIDNPNVYGALIAKGVATDPQTATDMGDPFNSDNITDADINNAVSAQWNDYANS